MLNAKIQITAAVIVILGFWVINHMVRKRSLELRYSLIWTIIGVMTLIIDLFPGLLGVLCRVTGINLPSNMLLVFGLLFAVVIIFYLTVNLSRMSNKERKMCQEIALLRKDMEDLASAQGKNKG